MMTHMKTPKTRAEFEYRLNLLRETLKRGKLRFAPGTGQGLPEIRYLPNGRIDFLSVNELARLQANSIHQFDNKAFKEILEKHGELGTQQESALNTSKDESSD